MARLLAWCDSPLAPTGFGRSAKHVLYALQEAGHEITQLAVNCDPHTVRDIPWRVFLPTDRANDPYGLRDLELVLRSGRYDVFFTTFDPEIPWFYQVDGKNVVDRIAQLRVQNPGFKMAGWFPVDGGPLSDAELAVLGFAPYFDAPVTMSPHVYDLVEWTMRLKGQKLNREKMQQRLRVIPHGVDLASYRIPTPEERAAAKRGVGFAKDAFVVLQVERNQQRKQNYLALEVMEKLFERRPELRGRVVLYQHMIPNEENEASCLGFNLPELAWRYGLQPGRDVFWPPGWVTESDMADKVYAAADCFLSVSTGEGFQYPAWEALACGIPTILPRDSARAAWFANVPNAHLYKTVDRRLVLRGGYKRRMAYADPAEAAKKIRKLVDKAPTAGMRAAGRAFVAKTADVGVVKRAWVEVFAGLEDDLHRDLAAAKIASARSPEPDVAWGHSRPVGFGDLVMSKPVIEALREQGRRTRLHVHRHMLEAAHACGLADEYTADALPEGAFDLSSFYYPAERAGWNDPKQSRTELIADLLSVDRALLQPRSAKFPDQVVEAVCANFVKTFGVPVSDCVAVCPQSGTKGRWIPEGYVEQLVAAIKALDLDAVPLILGSAAANCRQVGVIDMTGQTDLVAVGALLGGVAAAVCTDSGNLHLAALQKTPTVAVFNVVAPEARLGYYEGRIEVVRAPDEVGGKQFPPGEWAADADAWMRAIPCWQISAALKKVLDG